MGNKRVLGPALLLTTSIIWGSAFVVMKEALSGWPPALLLAVRFSLGTAVLCLMFLPRLRKIRLQELKHGGLVGLFLTAAYLTQTYGLNLTTPGKNAFLTTIYCVGVPFTSWLMTRRRPTRWNILGGLTCLVGIGLISLDEGLSIQAGDALTLLCGVLFSFQVSAVDWCATKGDDPVLITIIQSAVTAVVCWGIGLATEQLPASIPPDSWWQIAYLVICSTAIAELLQNIGQSMTPPALSAVLMSMESVFGALCSVLFYGETVTPRLVAGFAVVFLAVLISQKQGKKAEGAQTA